MTKSYKGVFEQFAVMAERVIERGASKLEDYLYYDDWTLLVINRICLDEADLSAEDQEKLKQFDKGIANSFTFRLLVEYTELYPEVIECWSKKEDEWKHLDWLTEIIHNSVLFSNRNCSEYVTFARYLIIKRKDKKENKDSREELEKALQAYERKLEKKLNDPQNFYYRDNFKD